MLKKISLGVLFLGLIGVLVYGAINRTVGKTELVAQAAGQGRRVTAEINDGEGTGRGAQAQELVGQGQGYQGDRSESKTTGLYANARQAVDGWILYEGTITQAPEPGVEMLVETDEGELIVGTGPLDLTELGLELQPGELVQVAGYWENGEFKAVQVTRPATGQTVALRDELGRPSWSGSVQNDQGGGQGNGSQGAGRGSNDSIGNGGGTGLGQAEVDAWITVQGTITRLDENQLLVVLDNGKLVTVENRPWWFALEQGFSAVAGDEISLTGFYEGDSFETGQITNHTSGMTVEIRQETGRPLWTGGGRRS